MRKFRQDDRFDLLQHIIRQGRHLSDPQIFAQLVNRFHAGKNTFISRFGKQITQSEFRHRHTERFQLAPFFCDFPDENLILIHQQHPLQISAPDEAVTFPLSKAMVKAVNEAVDIILPARSLTSVLIK